MFLEVENLSLRYGTEEIFSQLNFSLSQHSTLSILGQSGCGKTSMLKCLAGLTQPESGRILLEGRDITSVKPNQRSIIYLYQEDLLFPHLNVFENIAFGLRLKKRGQSEIKSAVSEMIEALELSGMDHKMPHQLSGGQRQRVSFGRAVINNPRLLLLDEPFGSLDAGTRKRMQDFYKSLAERYGISALFVTHDLKEAILMGDRVGQMQAGKLDIFDNKADFYRKASSGVQEEIDFWRSLGQEMQSKEL